MNGSDGEEKPGFLFQRTTQQLLVFLQEQHRRLKLNQPLASSVRPGPEGLVTRRHLWCGLEMVATSADPTSATLQIFFDPRRFETWKKDLGPVTMFYADPFGVEITYRKGAWAFFVEERRLPTDFAAMEVREVARLQIEKKGTQNEPLGPSSPLPSDGAPLPLPAVPGTPGSQGRDGVLLGGTKPVDRLLPRVQDHAPGSEGSQSERLLAALA